MALFNSSCDHITFAWYAGKINLKKTASLFTEIHFHIEAFGSASQPHGSRNEASSRFGVPLHCIYTAVMEQLPGHSGSPSSSTFTQALLFVLRRPRLPAQLHSDCSYRPLFHTSLFVCFFCKLFLSAEHVKVMKIFQNKIRLVSL